MGSHGRRLCQKRTICIWVQMWLYMLGRFMEARGFGNAVDSAAPLPGPGDRASGDQLADRAASRGAAARGNNPPKRAAWHKPRRKRKPTVRLRKMPHQVVILYVFTYLFIHQSSPCRPLLAKKYWALSLGKEPQQGGALD